MDRREQLLRHVDLRRGLGIEIGPLDKPVVTGAGVSVLYVDHASSDALRAKYRDDPNVSVDAIVPIDVEWAGGPLLGKLAGRGPIEWAVASHVLEHAPDPVGWLGALAEVLAPGGVLSLAVPDCRFCFDAKRRTTDVSELVAAALTGRTHPTLALTYDFWSKMTAVDPVRAWAGSPVGAEPDHEELALQKCRERLASHDYHDIHCSVFTPGSFVDAWAALVRLGMVPWFAVKDLRPTERDEIEFFVALERLPDELSPEERRRRQDASTASAYTSVAGAEVPGARPPAGHGEHLMAVSEKERMLIERKRAVLATTRRAVGRLRRGGGAAGGAAEVRPAGRGHRSP